jgi:hypothetical protein
VCRLIFGRETIPAHILDYYAIPVGVNSEKEFRKEILSETE